MAVRDVDRLRAFALERRVFTRAEVVTALGESAAAKLPALLGRDVARHARGVYSITGIAGDDRRVLAMIRETGAKALTPEERERDARRAEENAAAVIEARTTREDTIVDRVRAHFAANPVAGTKDLAEIGRGARAAAAALAERGEIDRVRDGLWTRRGIEPFGPEMVDYARANSVETAAVRREIEALQRIEGEIADDGVKWQVSRTGRTTLVYLNLPGRATIIASPRKDGIAWASKGGTLSPIACLHVARMLLNPVPERFGELAKLVDDGQAPTNVRRRHGGYREYVRPDEDEGNEPRRGWGVHDTHALDPRRLGKGVPEEVLLEIDDREDDRLVTMLTDVPNVVATTGRLEMADFVARLGERTLLFERKTTADLVASLDDNRLTEQVRRMSASGLACAFVIEGGVMSTRAVAINRLRNVTSRLQFGMGFTLIETIDIQDTAYSIVTAIRDHFFGEGARFDLVPVKTPGITDVERAFTLLQSIPGVSETRAAAILKRFGSIAGVARASVKEIATVDGIGRKTAEALAGVLHAGDAAAETR